MTETQDTWYPISQVAEIFGTSYVSAASTLEKAGVVRVDRDSQIPCAPESYLRHFPEFQVWQRRLHGQAGLRFTNRDLPDLPRVAPDMMPRRQILRHWATLMEGEVSGPEQVDHLLIYGRWRARRSGSTYYYRLRDFVMPDEWASEAEKSWREGLGHIRAAITQQKKRLEPLPPEAEQPPEDAPGAEEPTRPAIEGPEDMPWLATSPVLRLHEPPPKAPQPIEGGYPKFKFYQNLRQPGAADYADYLGFIPAGLLEGAARRASEWTACLEEERTGLRRATGQIKDKDFKDEFARIERAIYRERGAWVQGMLTPLLPPAFAFLF